MLSIANIVEYVSPQSNLKHAGSRANSRTTSAESPGLCDFLPLDLFLKSGCRARGVAFMTVLEVLTVSVVLESTLPSFCLSYKMQDKETKGTILAIMAVSVMTATPLNSTPFSDSLKKGKATKVRTNRGVQMRFANLLVNQPCCRLDCGEAY